MALYENVAPVMVNKLKENDKIEKTALLINWFALALLYKHFSPHIYYFYNKSNTYYLQKDPCKMYY